MTKENLIEQIYSAIVKVEEIINKKNLTSVWHLKKQESVLKAVICSLKENNKFFIENNIKLAINRALSLIEQFDLYFKRDLDSKKIEQALKVLTCYAHIIKDIAEIQLSEAKDEEVTQEKLDNLDKNITDYFDLTEALVEKDLTADKRKSKMILNQIKEDVKPKTFGSLILDFLTYLVNAIVSLWSEKPKEDIEKGKFTANENCRRNSLNTNASISNCKF